MAIAPLPAQVIHIHLLNIEQVIKVEKYLNSIYSAGEKFGDIKQLIKYGDKAQLIIDHTTPARYEVDINEPPKSTTMHEIKSRLEKIVGQPI